MFIEIANSVEQIESIRPLADEWKEFCSCGQFGLEVDVNAFLAGLMDLVDGVDSDLLLLIDDTEIVGIMGLTKFQSPFGKEMVASEHYMFVKQGHSVTGGKRLIDAAQGWAKKNGCSHLIMNASNAASDMLAKVCRLYERLGMKPFEMSYIKDIRKQRCIIGCFDSAKKESKETSSAKTAGQKQLLQQLIDKFSPEIDKGPSVFPGETVAGLSDLQETGIGAAGDIGGAFTTPTTSKGFGEGPLAGETTTAVSDLLTGQLGAQEITAGQFGDFFKTSTSDPARKAFREETDPAIREAFAGPGFFSSARSKETVKQKADLEDRLSSSLSAGQFANLQNNQRIAEAKAGRTQGAVGQAIQVGEAQTQTVRDNIAIAATQVQGLKELMGIGAVEQTQEQQEIFAEVEKFAQEQQLVDPEDLAVLMALLNLNFSTSSGKSRSSGAGFGQQAALAFI